MNDIKDKLKEKGMVPEATASDVIMAAFEELGDGDLPAFRVMVIVIRQDEDAQVIDRYSNCHSEYEETGILDNLRHRQLSNWEE